VKKVFKNSCIEKRAGGSHFAKGKKKKRKKKRGEKTILQGDCSINGKKKLRGKKSTGRKKKPGEMTHEEKNHERGN